jgi:hypothetical protein
VETDRGKRERDRAGRLWGDESIDKGRVDRQRRRDCVGRQRRQTVEETDN